VHRPTIDRLPGGRRTRAIALGATYLALLGGCGSYTKQDFVARADAICSSALRQIRTIPPPSSSARLNELAAYLREVLPVAQAESRQLHALKVPGGSASEHRTLARYLAALSGTVQAYGRLAAAAAAGDPAGVAAAEAALRDSPSAALAAAYGLHSCGSARGTVA
jgi:hypothetical protein